MKPYSASKKIRNVHTCGERACAECGKKRPVRVASKKVARRVARAEAEKG